MWLTLEFIIYNSVDKTFKGAVRTVQKSKCFSGIKTLFPMSTGTHCREDVTITKSHTFVLKQMKGEIFLALFFFVQANVFIELHSTIV